MSGKLNNTMALILAIILAATQMPFTAYAENSEVGGESYAVTSFSELPIEVAVQSVPTGTPLDGLTLPDTLTAIHNGEFETECEITGVTWQSEPEYNPDTEGTYEFTSVLPEGYSPADGVSLPRIVVEVAPEAAPGINAAMGIRSMAVSSSPVVMNADDSGAGSLRQTIIDAPDGSTISFDQTAFATKKIITLASELTIDKSLTIEGSEAGVELRVNGGFRHITSSTGFITFTLKSLTFTGRKTTSTDTANPGGGIGTYNNSITSNIENCTIRDCYDSSTGGGLELYSGGSITNCTIVNNSSGDDGGGAYVTAQNLFTNCTIVNNSAVKGGGIFRNGGQPVIYGSIVAGNTGNNVCGGSTIWQDAAPTAANGYNIIGGTSGYSLSDVFGTATPVLNNNGGPTQTILIKEKGPAHDIIPTAGLTWSLPSADQRGQTRPYDSGSADIGAVELQSSAREKLAAPTGVSVSNTGLVSWNSVANAGSYTVKVYKGSNPTALVTLTGKNGTSYQLVNTDAAGNITAAGTDYCVTVTAISGNTSSFTDSDESAKSSGTFMNVYSIALTTSGLTTASGDSISLNGAAVTTDTATTVYAIESTTITFSTAAGAGREVAISGAVSASGNITNINTSKAFTATFSALPALGKVQGATLSSTGQATWTDLASETGLAHYSVQLYKNGSSLGFAKTSTAATGGTGVSFLAEMRAAGVGSYTVAVTATGNGATHSNGAASDASGAQSVSKLSVPANLAWSGSSAAFDKLADETDADKYSVTITGSGTIGGFQTADVAKTGSNLAAAVTNPANGDTFKVKAIALTTGLFLDSDESAASAPYGVAFQHTITASAGAGGSISPTGSVTVTGGGSRTFTINADSGYSISGVTVDGVNVGAVSSYTISNVTGNHTIHAAFSPKGSGGGGGGGSAAAIQSQIVYAKINGQTVTAILSGNGILTLTYAASYAKKYAEDTGIYEIEIPEQCEHVNVNIPIQALGGEHLNIKTDFGMVQIPSGTLQVLRQKYGDMLRLVIIKGSFEIALIDEKGSEIAYSNPANPFTLALPYELKSGQKPGAVVAVGKGGRIIPFAAYSGGRISFEITETGRYDVIYNKMDFDDIAGHWALDYINFVTARAIFGGDGTGHFFPDSSMSRAMFAQVLANLDGVDLSVYNTSNFSDVPVGAWYAPAVEWAAEKGIVSGIGDGRFDPDVSVTHEQMAVILVNYMRCKGYALSAGSSPTLVNEGTISAWALDAVKAMQNAGIVGGKQGSKLVLMGTATRAEVATIFARLVEYVANGTASGSTAQTVSYNPASILAILPGNENENTLMNSNSIE